MEVTTASQVGKWTPERLEKAAADLEPKGPDATLEMAVESFHPSLYFACSFQKEESVILDMLSKIQPQARIFYLDTGSLFPEILETRDRLAERYGFTFERYFNANVEEDEKPHGGDLCRRQHPECCNIRKVKPLEDALSKVDAWITGIRRDQAPARANAKKVEHDQKFGIVKFNPLADWTDDDCWEYIRKNDVPYCLLHDQGYPSIGCSWATRKVEPGEDPRAGRWSGNEKTECGLHE